MVTEPRRKPEPAVVVVGASAGGVAALSDLVGQLPGDLDAAILVVLHLAPSQRSMLPQILSRSGPFPAVAVSDTMPLEKGRIYVAPEDHHMEVEDSKVFVHRGPRESGFRPSIDRLFRSAAQALGPRLTAVLLTGALDDGVDGLSEVKRRGGTTLVQDPAEAPHPSMPTAALARGNVDLCLPLSRIASVLAVVHGRADTAEAKALRAALAEAERPVERDLPPVCPECNGPLTEQVGGSAGRYSCRVGHEFSLDALVSAHDAAVERTLWAGLRSLEERVSLYRRVEGQLEARGLHTLAETWSNKRDEAANDARIVRDLLGRGLGRGDAPGAQAGDKMPRAEAREERNGAVPEAPATG